MNERYKLEKGKEKRYEGDDKGKEKKTRRERRRTKVKREKRDVTGRRVSSSN